MLALHLLFAIFAIGPLVHATMTASRGLQGGDDAATQAAARMTRIYAIGSILVIVFGFALMSATSPYTHKAVATFSDGHGVGTVSSDTVSGYPLTGFCRPSPRKGEEGNGGTVPAHRDHHVPKPTQSAGQQFPGE